MSLSRLVSPAACIAQLRWEGPLSRRQTVMAPKILVFVERIVLLAVVGWLFWCGGAVRCCAGSVCECRVDVVGIC